MSQPPTAVDCRARRAATYLLAVALLLASRVAVGASDDKPQSANNEDEGPVLILVPRPEVREIEKRAKQSPSGEEIARRSATSARLDEALDELKRERDSVTAVMDSRIPDARAGSSVAEQREVLRGQLQSLLGELVRQPKPEHKPVSAPSNVAKQVVHRKVGQASRGTPGATAETGTKPNPGTPGGADTPIDALALAQALFRIADYDGALKAFRLAERATASPHDRVAIRYFSAACMAKLGQRQEATMLFREVANSKDDELLAECARWHLSAYQWREATEARLAQLREVGIAPKSNSGDQSP